MRNGHRIRLLDRQVWDKIDMNTLHNNSLKNSHVERIFIIIKKESTNVLIFILKKIIQKFIKVRKIIIKTVTEK